MNDPGLEQIGDALVRVARDRAAPRPAGRRARRRVVAGAAAAVALAAVGALALAGAWPGGGSAARASGPGFTQAVFVYADGRANAVGCAVARCETINRASTGKVTSVELVSVARTIKLARVIGAGSRATRVPSTTDGGGSVIFRFERSPRDAVVVELLNAAGDVVQTLRE
jgi:hypothetical protein